MAETKILSINSSTQKEESIDRFQEWLLTLPTEKNWDGTTLYLYKGCWCPSFAIRGVVSFQQNFIANDSDIILASMPKCGTTWLKALTFSIVHRNKYPPKQSPLLSTPPHELVPFLENDLFLKTQSPNLEKFSDFPRIFAVHSHYSSLPNSIKDSDCRIVYICRNPLDQLISFFHFAHKFVRENVEPIKSVDEGFEKTCEGVLSYGPFWDSVLGYWKASLERPNEVLFLKYEDLKDDIVFQLKKVAEFLGFPFSEEEERDGVVEEISRLCSFDSLKDIGVNKSGLRPSGAPNSAFFRKGEVGDWNNYLNPSMAERLNRIVEEKLAGSGLAFKMSL